MAPEILTKAGHGKPVDLWSIGVMAYFLLCGYMPYTTDRKGNTELELVLAGNFEFHEKYWRFYHFG